ncbi:MAG: response regulator transcription factor [Bacteroidales bacterium]
MNRIKFIVAEQSYLIRKGIVSVINRIDFATVVKELDNLERINSEILNHNPDFIVLNPNLIPENKNFINFDLKLDLHEKGIALISTPPYRKGMIDNFRLILNVNDTKSVLFQKLESLVEETSNQKNIRITNNELSDREKTILKHVAKGQTNKEIAENLYLSTHTVITHRKNITAKLGIKTISGLTVYAILNNLVTLEEIKE